MRSSVLGFIAIAIVFTFALSERPAGGAIGFFDLHAALVVFGGVFGALFIALSKESLIVMGKSFLHHFLGLKSYQNELKSLKSEWSQIQSACRDGKRTLLLNLIEKSSHPEVRASCELLVSQSEGLQVQEKFSSIRQQYLTQYEPVIEGWDLVARLAPSFGMVGTVAGMVQLFKNMADADTNLGGAMGMALLATLYGIAFGTAIGGPMSTKMNNELNERLNLLDFCEVSTGALLQELRQGDRR